MDRVVCEQEEQPSACNKKQHATAKQADEQPKQALPLLPPLTVVAFAPVVRVIASDHAFGQDGRFNAIVSPQTWQ
jgi:hypothetical protein